VQARVGHDVQDHLAVGRPERLTGDRRSVLAPVDGLETRIAFVAAGHLDQVDGPSSA
jgi:hypothetical protein